MEVDQITEGLDRDHGARYAFRPVRGRAEKLFQTLIGALAELAQEFSIESKIGPQHLGYSEDILTMGEGVIRKILTHLDETAASTATSLLPKSRGHHKRASSGKPIIQTIGCSDFAARALSRCGQELACNTDIVRTLPAAAYQNMLKFCRDPGGRVR